MSKKYFKKQPQPHYELEWLHYYINIFLYMYTCYTNVVSASTDLEGGKVLINSFLLWQLYPSLCHSVGLYRGRAMLRADLNFFHCKKYMLKWYQYFFKSKNIWNMAIHLFGLIWSIDLTTFFFKILIINKKRKLAIIYKERKKSLLEIYSWSTMNSPTTRKSLSRWF
jgi:hypothetical protein